MNKDDRDLAPLIGPARFEPASVMLRQLIAPQRRGGPIRVDRDCGRIAGRTE